MKIEVEKLGYRTISGTHHIIILKVNHDELFGIGGTDNFVKYIEAYDRAKKIVTGPITINNEFTVGLIAWLEEQMLRVTYRPCKIADESEKLGEYKALANVKLHIQSTIDNAKSAKPEPDPIPCKNCGKPIFWKPSPYNRYHHAGEEYHQYCYGTGESKAESGTVPCLYCDRPIHWDNQKESWLHENDYLFCGEVGNISIMRQPTTKARPKYPLGNPLNEPLDFGLSDADKVGVKENEAKARPDRDGEVMDYNKMKIGGAPLQFGVTTKEALENVVCGINHARNKEAKAKPDHIDLDINDANGESVYLATLQNDKIVITDEFAEAIAKAFEDRPCKPIITKTVVANDSEMPIEENKSILLCRHCHIPIHLDMKFYYYVHDDGLRACKYVNAEP